MFGRAICKSAGMAPKSMLGDRMLSRLILVTFAFLAFAFYQMSGGPDFDPVATRMARVDAPVVVEGEQPQQVAVPASTALPENVTRVALSLTSVNDVLRPTSLNTTPARIVPPVETPDPQAVSEEEPTIILPSLIVDQSAITPVTFDQNAGDEIAAAPEPTGSFSIRSVAGNSVNVRGGPGTDYAVVSRLTRGDQVEILQDPGQGWVQLRPVGGGTVGWMADFLLSDG